MPLLRHRLHSSGAAVLLYDRDFGHAAEAAMSHTRNPLVVPFRNAQLIVRQVEDSMALGQHYTTYLPETARLVASTTNRLVKRDFVV